MKRILNWLSQASNTVTWGLVVALIGMTIALGLTRNTLEKTQLRLAVAATNVENLSKVNEDFVAIAQRQNNAVLELLKQRSEDTARYEAALSTARRSAARAEARAERIESLPKPEVVTVEKLNELLNEALKEVQK